VKKEKKKKEKRIVNPRSIIANVSTNNVQCSLRIRRTHCGTDPILTRTCASGIIKMKIEPLLIFPRTFVRNGSINCADETHDGSKSRFPPLFMGEVHNRWTSDKCSKLN